MKRNALLLTGALLCALAAGPALAAWLPVQPDAAPGTEPRFTLLDGDETATTLRVELPGLWSEQTARFGAPLTELEVPEGGTLRQLGLPAIPTAARLLTVPADAEPWVEVLDVELDWFDAPPPTPAQPHPTRAAAGEVAFPDPILYTSDALWPAELAAVDDLQFVRGVALLRVELRLAQVDFASGQLGLVRSATVRVHHGGSAPALGPDAIDSPAFAGAIAPQIFNYVLPDSGVPAPPESMLVIVEQALQSAIQPLVDWKQQRGIQVTVRTLEEVGSTLETVQAAIDEAYDSWDPPATYVLLVGDNVPFYRGDYDYCASDYMFTTLDGDLLPDVLISRVVGATPDEVSVQVNKVLSYEKTPPTGTDGDWLRKVTGAACAESGSGPSDDQRFDLIAESMTAYGYTHIDKFYERDGSGTAQNIQAALDDGRGWLFYLGHGSGYDFSSMSPPYSVSHVNQMANGSMWPLVVDCSCLNGGFETPGNDCMSEALMKHGTPDAPLGAVGNFASSTSTSWDPAGDLAEGVAYGFADNGHAYWGAAALWARAYVFERWGSGMDSEWLFQQWVLFGDASLQIRSMPALEPVVSYPGGFPMAESEFTVTVTVDDQPFPYATVALHKPGEWDEVALTDADGAATFTLTPTDKGPMEVVVTGRDLVPHIGSAEAGKLGGLGSGCGAAANPFSFNPAGLGFTGTLTSATPLAPAMALALLLAVVLVRRVGR
jgi:hypothetical protein